MFRRLQMQAAKQGNKNAIERLRSEAKAADPSSVIKGPEVAEALKSRNRKTEERKHSENLQDDYVKEESYGDGQCKVVEYYNEDGKLRRKCHD